MTQRLRERGPFEYVLCGWCGYIEWMELNTLDSELPLFGLVCPNCGESDDLEIYDPGRE